MAMKSSMLCSLTSARKRGVTEDLGQGLSNQRGSVPCQNMVGGSARSLRLRRCRW
jgi:hypothetical protein